MSNPYFTPTTRDLTSDELRSMKKYRCHKEIHALPMNRGQYNEYRGWDLPENENPLDPGYLVIYDRGTPDHYESWSPADKLEKGYTEIPPEPGAEHFGDLHFAWLAEREDMPGVYASRDSSISPVTTDATKAAQFSNKEDCTDYCVSLNDNGRILNFRPKEHGFFY